MDYDHRDVAGGEMRPDSEWDRSSAPLPWMRVTIGEDDTGQPVCVVLDKFRRHVCQNMSLGDADLIVAAVNKYQP